MSRINDLTETLPVAIPDKSDISTQETAGDAELLRASIKAGTVAQIVVAAIAIIGFIYLLKLVLVTTLSSVLLAYILEPIVGWLVLLRLPRWIGALVGTLLVIIITVGLAYFSFNRAIAFSDQLPYYSARIRQTVGGILSRASQIEDRARAIVQPPNVPKQQPVPVKVE